MSIMALVASLAFSLTRRPLIFETEATERVMLQASQLSHVHEYFETQTEDPSSLSFYESFKATFYKDRESMRESALIKNEG